MENIIGWNGRIALMVAIYMVLNTSLGIAQIVPVDFLCVENDTLKWATPANTCRDFEQYHIYYSNTANGNFQLLTSISDENTTSFYHENANSANNRWLYYIRSQYDCSPNLSIPSDTLDNRDPDFPLINAVSVVDNGIEVSWTRSNAPETAGYIIYRNEENLGFVELDRVHSPTTTTYLDTSARTARQSEEYTIIAIDDCGNTSIFNTEPQASIFLTVDINPCTQTAALNWTAYKNWTEGIDRYEIWLSENDEEKRLVGTVDSDALSYEIDGLNDATKYCFSVVAHRAEKGFTAASNAVCLTSDIIQPTRNFQILSVSHTPDDSIAISWTWDTAAEVESVRILASPDEYNYSPVYNFSPPTPLKPIETIKIAPPSSDSLETWYYKIQTTDPCDTTATSTYAATLSLTGNVDVVNTQNELNWQPLDIEGATITSYKVFKIIENQPQQYISIFPAEQLQYIDIWETSTAPQVCYYVIGAGHLILPNGQLYGIASRSNLFCPKQRSLIIFPNAFAPNGINNIFKPSISTPESIAKYELRIFNRWGEQLFSSQDHSIGWTGEGFPRGIYIYTMTATLQDGTKEERKGTVALVR